MDSGKGRIGERGEQGEMRKKEAKRDREWEQEGKK